MSFAITTSFGSGSGYATPDRVQQRENPLPPISSFDQFCGVAVDRFPESLFDLKSYATQWLYMSCGDIVGIGARILFRRYANVHSLFWLGMIQYVADEGLMALQTSFFSNDHGPKAFLVNFEKGLISRSVISSGMSLLNFLPKGMPLLLTMPIKLVAQGGILSVGGMMGEGIAAGCLNSQEPSTPMNRYDIALRILDSMMVMLKGGIVRQVPVRSYEIMKVHESRVTPLRFWSSDVSVSQVMDLAKAEKYGEIRPPAKVGDIFIRRDERIVERVKDAIYVERSYLIPRPSRGETRMVSWLIKVPTGSDGRVTADLEKQAQVISAYLGPPRARPLQGVRRLDAKSFVDSVAYLLDTVYEAKMGSYGLSFIDKRFTGLNEMADQAYATLMSRDLRIVYGELTRLKGIGTDRTGIVDVIHRQLEAVHRLSEAANQEIVNRFGGMDVEFAEQAGAFEFEGVRYPGYRALQRGLRAIEDPGKRERLLRATSVYFDRFRGAPGNYYDTIPDLNRIAREHGMNGYVDHVFGFRFGMNGEEFDRRFQSLMAITRPKGNEYLEKLSQLKRELDPSSNGRVKAWDVDYLGDRLFEKIAGKKEPTFSPAQAQQILQRVFDDLGIDLDSPPYNRIVIDFFRRETKTNNQGMATPVSLGRAYFTSNADPAEPLTLHQVYTLVHEMTHCVTFVTAAEKADGHYFLTGEFAPGTWMEGIADTIGGGILTDPRFVRRYFGDLMDERQYEALASVYNGKAAFEFRLQTLNAWMEVNLYRETDPTGRFRPISERKQAWTAMVREHLGVDDFEDGVSIWTTIPHLTYKEYHLYYPSYTFGRLMTDAVLNSHLREGRPEELSRFGDTMVNLMRRGVRITEEDLRRAAVS